MKYFGTDGIRGKFGEDLIQEAFLKQLAQALVLYLKSKLRAQCEANHLHVVIGRDTRISGPIIERWLQEGLGSGIKVTHLGVVPTPAVAYGVNQLSADLGIAITASHNPSEDNGIKLFNHRGMKLSETEESAIEAFIDQILESKWRDFQISEKSDNAFPVLQEKMPRSLYSPAVGNEDILNFYCDALIDRFKAPLGHSFIGGQKIVLDTACGATTKSSAYVLNALGAKVIQIGRFEEGKSINDGVGSEYPKILGEKVIETGAALGIAHDGDGDRIIICDRHGIVLDGDILLGILGLDALSCDKLDNKSMVVTIQSNLGLDETILAAGGRVFRSAVGDRNVFSKMEEVGAIFGGESSGHLIFRDLSTTGDGLLSALKILSIWAREGYGDLAKWRDEVRLFPQITDTLVVKAKRPLHELKAMLEVQREIELYLRARGRVLIRYSGTEPKLRFLIEGEGDIGDWMMHLKSAARKELGLS